MFFQENGPSHLRHTLKQFARKLNYAVTFRTSVAEQMIEYWRQTN
jgi:hypothetical protein